MLGIASLVFLFIYKRLQYWKNRNVPYIEPKFFYGNSKGISKKFHSAHFVNEMYKKLKSQGPIGGIYIYVRAIALVTDLDLIKNILVKDFTTFPNRGSYSNEKDDPLSAHLVNLEDDPWRSLRQKLTPTFTSGKLKMMFGTISEVADKLIKTIEKETTATGQLEVKDVLSRFTTDVIGTTAFGIDCNSLEDKTTKFYEMGLKAFSSFNFFKRAFLLTFKELARKLHMTSSNKEIGEFYTGVVRETIKYRKENPQVQRNDFMNLLIKLKDSGELTFNQITAQSIVFFLAGYETSSTTLTYCMYELSINQDIQKKARDSVQQVLKKHGNNLTYESINEMDYLEQCINEALRKYPPAANTQRVAKEDYEIPNTKIVLEKGTSVMIPIYAIHHDPEIYTQPDKYDPDRFSPEEVAKRHQFSFMPFGEGPRICIGLRFAVLEVKIALVKILTNFEFKLDRSKTSIPMKFSPRKLILSPDEDIMINFDQIKP